MTLNTRRPGKYDRRPIMDIDRTQSCKASITVQCTMPHVKKTKLRYSPDRLGHTKYLRLLKGGCRVLQLQATLHWCSRSGRTAVHAVGCKSRTPRPTTHLMSVGRLTPTVAPFVPHISRSASKYRFKLKASCSALCRCSVLATSSREEKTTTQFHGSSHSSSVDKTF